MSKQIKTFFTFHIFKHRKSDFLVIKPVIFFAFFLFFFIIVIVFVFYVFDVIKKTIKA